MLPLCLGKLCTYDSIAARLHPCYCVLCLSLSRWCLRVDNKGKVGVGVLCLKSWAG